MIYKGLPVYEATIPNDADGMVVCSLVKNAAVESDFLAFDENVKPLEFAVENEEQRMVLGVVMKANYLIFRHHPDFGDFYITYSPETIQKMVERFFNEHYVNSVDLEHSFQLEEGVHLVQAFIKNKEKGIDPVDFQDCEDGSLFFQYHIENDDIWNAIKEGTFQGFSIAGTFGLEETFSKQEQNNNNTEKENKFMSKLNRIKQALKSLLIEFGEISTDGGVLIWDTDEDLKIGDTVHSIDENGNNIEVADGTYTTEDKKQIIVKDGRVEDIVDVDAEVSTDVPTEEENKEEEQENADEEPTEEPTEEPKEDEGEDKNAIIEELKARIAELEKENEELKAKLDEEPAAPSASEAFEALENTPKAETEADKLRKRGYKF